MIDLFCCTPGDLFFLLSPIPPSAGRLKRRDINLYNIWSHSDEVASWATSVAWSGWLVACIEPRLAQAVYYSAMTFAVLRQQPRYNVCCDFKCCCSILFHLDNELKQTQISMVMWLSTTSELILSIIHSRSNVKTNKVIKPNVFIHGYE